MLNVNVTRLGRATCTVCNVLHDWPREQRTNNRTMLPAQRSSGNRAFETCRSTELGILFSKTAIDNVHLSIQYVSVAELVNTVGESLDQGGLKFSKTETVSIHAISIFLLDIQLFMPRSGSTTIFQPFDILIQRSKIACTLFRVFARC